MMLNNVLLAMGLSCIDENLTGLIESLGTPSIGVNLTGMGQALGAVLCLIVGCYECWMMMLGKRGMDVMKILRIIGISICIACSSAISAGLAQPGVIIEKAAKDWAMQQHSSVEALEQKCAEKSAEFSDKVKEAYATASQKTNENWTFNVAGMEVETPEFIQKWIEQTHAWFKSAAISMETGIAEFINTILRICGTFIFQMVFYGLMVGQKCFLMILGIWCPIAFALSLAPPLKNAWVQWLCKYLSLTLWGFVAYIVLGYVFLIMQYNLSQDLAAYNLFIGSADDTGWSEIGQLGLQMIGSTCMYVMSLLIGAFMMKFIPDVASWLIPGGTSSGFGGVAAAAAMGGAAMAGGAMGSAASGAAGYIGAKAYDNLHHDYGPISGDSK